MLGRRPPHGDGDAGPDLGELRAEPLGEQRAPEIRRAPSSGSASARAKQLARRLLPAAAQHLLGAQEQHLDGRHHLEVLHQHLRQVRLAVARLADQRDDRRRGAAGRGARRLEQRPQEVVAAHQRRDAHPRGRPLGGLRRLLQPRRPRPSGHRLDGKVGQHLRAAGDSNTPGGIRLAGILLLLGEQRALVAAGAVGPRLDRDRRQIDERPLARPRATKISAALAAARVGLSPTSWPKARTYCAPAACASCAPTPDMASRTAATLLLLSKKTSATARRSRAGGRRLGGGLRLRAGSGSLLAPAAG